MLKNASGLYNLMRNLGGAVGLALINTLAQDRSYLHRLHLAEQVGWGRQRRCEGLDAMTGALAPRLGSAGRGARRRCGGWTRWCSARRWCWPTTTSCC